jgi:hypothetical protein
VYRFTNGTAVLLSCGPDKTEGTADDIFPDNTATNLPATVGTNTVP